jgi:hypothetical protein
MGRAIILMRSSPSVLRGKLLSKCLSGDRKTDLSVRLHITNRQIAKGGFLVISLVRRSDFEKFKDALNEQPEA